ncbi:MAG: long-chain fatty acid--CoA ligase [Candidatus Cloacimonadota bacterium]|nr:MAG: long-chain fatty acid--CoA ligase [Candidatus Cloacimonadota bacterium]
MNTKLSIKSSQSYDYPLLIKKILYNAKYNSPNQKIIHHDGGSYNYLEFYDRVAKLANMLTNQGVGAGDVVAFLDWDTHRYLEAFFAVPMIGAILHTVNVRLSPQQILFTMNHAEDKVVIVSEDFFPIVEGIQDAFQTVEKVITISNKSSSSLKNYCGNYESLMKPESTQYDFLDFDERSIATLFYTTGTTGDPKGVTFTHRQLVLHTFSIIATMGSIQTQNRLRSDSVYIPLTPMFHVHAWGLPYITTFLGTKQVYPGRYDSKSILEMIKKHKITFSHCVPAIMNMLLQHSDSNDYDLSGWSVVIGGSALPYGLAKKALERGIDIFTGYGLSETCPVLTLTNMTNEQLNLDVEGQLPFRMRAGKPLGLVEIKILGGNGEDFTNETTKTGEIVVRTPWLTQSYYKNEEASEILWDGGWLHTGDIGYFDSDGFLNITDRLKDVIKTGGEWISSLELESMISKMNDVIEVAVVGLPDDKWGERPYALLHTNGLNITAQEVANHLSQFVEDGTINKWAIPETIEIVESIPKTSVGKINKKEIREKILKLRK